MDDLHCFRCEAPKEVDELDRLLWCESCIVQARSRAASVGWVVGILLAGGLAAWIWLVQKPSRLVIGGWIGTVVAALWLGARIGREVSFGVERARHRPK